jgi:Aspartyl/Asparaginyl beta-hydroxylase
MDTGEPLVEYGSVDIADLREKMLLQTPDYWEIDRAARVKLAGHRPGNAVFFYNDMPPCVNRGSLGEVQSGLVNVLRYPSRALFAEVQRLIEAQIAPLFPQCSIMRVQLTELPPGSTIQPHRDVGILALIHRLHVPIVTHDDVKFFIAGQVFSLKPGRLYDLNNVVVHSVENRSDVMRVHLMVDMLPYTVAKARYFDSESSFVSAVAA